MNAYDVLFDHHNTLRGLCKKITAMPPTSDETAANPRRAVGGVGHPHAHRERVVLSGGAGGEQAGGHRACQHRQVFDQLAVVLRTAPEAPGYQTEWESFVMVLDARAAEEERDLCPPPVEISDDELNALGIQMRQRMADLRGSTIEKLHIKGRTALLRTF
jgi:hypothetical protein